jgi:DNA-binding protein HU-beta
LLYKFYESGTLRKEWFTMTKKELIDKVAEVEGVESKKAAERSVNAILETIIAEVAAGNDVTLIGFGTFKAVKAAARESINPQTKQKITVPERTVPKFKAGKKFKDTVAEASNKKSKKGKKK